MRAIEFYSGIGGLHLALKRSGQGRVIRAFDWDQTACNVYKAFHGEGIVQRVDILTLNPQELFELNADLWLLSPACQPYTVLNPNARGMLDPRAQSFLYIINQLLPAVCPSHLLIENVAGFEGSSTRQMLISRLQSLNYFVVEFLLTPLQFGIPNSRLRYYLLARRRPFSETSDEILHHIPGLQDVEPVNLHFYLDTANNEQYLVTDKTLEKWGRLFDIVLPSSQRTCCFTRGYTKLVERAGSILQMNESLDTTKTFDRFLEAQSSGNHDAVEILHPLRLRYFSPSELLRLFDFLRSGLDKEFLWPDNVTIKSRYRLIGNSVNVRVVTALIGWLCGN